jgi:hypothetical protein
MTQMTQNMPAGLQNDTAVIMYKSKRKPVGAISVKVNHACDGLGKTGDGRACVSRGGFTRNSLRMGM